MHSSLILERPGHVPRLLGFFRTWKDADRGRSDFVSEKPEWQDYVYVVDHESEEEVRSAAGAALKR